MILQHVRTQVWRAARGRRYHRHSGHALLAFFLLVLSPCGARIAAQVGAQQASNEPSLQQLVEAQQTALESGDADQVFKTSRDLAAFTLRLLAALNMENGDPASAAEHYSQSIDVEDSPDTRLELATTSLIRKDVAGAVVQIDKVISMQPANPLAWRLRGEALLLNRDNKGAVEALERSDGIAPNVETELLLLKAWLVLKQTSQVSLLIQRIVDRNGDSARLRLLIASSLEQVGDLTGAIRETTRAVSLEPGSRDAHLALGMAFWELNEYQYNEDSLQHFTEAQHLDPTGYLSNLQLGTIESQFHLFEEAAKHLQSAAIADPSSPAPWLQLGLNFYEQNRSSEARHSLERYVALATKQSNDKDLQFRRALLVLSRLSAEDGREVEASRLAAEAERIKQQLAGEGNSVAPNQSVGTVTANPPVSIARQSMRPSDHLDFPAASSSVIEQRDHQLRDIVAKSLNDMGTVLARNHDYAGAMVPLRYASLADGQLYPVMRNLGLAAYHTGAYDESQKAFAQAIAQRPEDLLSHGYLGMSLFFLNCFSQAADVFHSAEAAIRSNALFGSTYALTLIRIARPTQAEAILSDLLASAQGPDVQVSAAAVYLELGNASRAEELARAALSASPNTQRAHLIIGKVLMQKGKDAEALDEFRAELANLGDLPDVRAAAKETKVLLAEALINSGKHLEAESIVSDLKRDDPEYANLRRKQGEVLLKAGAIRAALVDLHAAATLDPQMPGVRSEIAGARRLLNPPPH